MAKILLVEEYVAIRLLYSEELKEAGHETVGAENPFKVLEKIEEEKPDILICGIKHKDYNWRDLIIDVKERYPGLPIIFSTSRVDLWKEALEMGATECFGKSADLNRLREIIKRIMAASRECQILLQQ